MRQRCNDTNCPNYHKYGARGITVCDRWNDFARFLEDMGERPCGMTLGRIDNHKNYQPNNCRWETNSQQARNKRNTRFLTLNGVTKPSADWADQLGIPKTRIRDRLHKGWSDERILTNPGKRVNQYA